ncbi:hypothetical protein LOD99_9867 [Oopsacas minuta]|uniref:Transposase n=1 Tax=Oopsacas minuta TaxID=111878 RepID=A0AAV7KK15_9METZ|nr:hypothetical protein LOD99_9867 [Oopsacas minuta]
MKINKGVYVESILENALKPSAGEHFNGAHWLFQQDSAPSHKAKMTSEWLKLNVRNLYQLRNGRPLLRSKPYGFLYMVHLRVQGMCIASQEYRKSEVFPEKRVGFNQ